MATDTAVKPKPKSLKPRGAPTKKSINLYLNKEIYIAAQQTVKRIPGATVSAWIDELLAGSMPAINAFLDEAEKDPSFMESDERQEVLFSQLMAVQALKLMTSKIAGIHMLVEGVKEQGQQEAA
jgi:hypothetical protein